MGIPNSYDLLQAVIEATPDAIFVKDLQGRYVLINEAFARFLNRPPAEIVGKNDLELYPEETARRFMSDDQKVLASGQPQSFEGVATSASGTQAYLVTKGVYRDKDSRILGLYGISHDITELRLAHQTLEQTREALFQSQKMEAVGQLTGGIAHDFNNILAVILGNIELLKLHLRADPYAHELIETILRAALHGQELTGDLLAFSRHRQLDPRPVGINAFVEGIVRFLSRTLGAKVRITTALSPDAGVALVDPAALEAAVLNVALNARDAMPDGGSIAIRTSKIEIPESTPIKADLAPGSYVVVALQDTGYGMSPEIVSRAFEPFFTTKAGTGGTGLGLSMVYGFAKQSGGRVAVDSEPERGTTVSIFLPLAQSEPRAVATATTTRTATIPRELLVVEDEPAVRNTIKRQLEGLGHRVSVCESAAEALLWIQQQDTIDVLLTDVVLGTGMNGFDLADAARALRPDLPVIFISGYTAMPEAQQRIRGAGAPLLSKPATMTQLERAVNDVTRGTNN
jgi:two-component system, cell cycle sensor histidine kinase and response regulator CckA